MKANPKILVPSDFSPSADAALDYAVELALQLKGSIVLMSAW
ncbi:MAG TPA: universal stress protein, partial [bacterium]|nr:universal stress protein [bacterium]